MNDGFADFVRKSDLDGVMRERDEARRELIWFKEQNDKLWSRIRKMELDGKEDARAAATEASWKERQGEEYGSY